MAVRRGFVLVLALLTVAVLISASGVAVMWLMMSRQPSVSRNSTLVLDLDTDLREASPEDVFRQLVSGHPTQTLATVVENLRKAKVDRRVGAVPLDELLAFLDAHGVVAAAR